MFWIFISLVALAATFTKLGAVSVVSKILWMALKMSIFAVAGLLFLLLGAGKKSGNPQ